MNEVMSITVSQNPSFQNTVFFQQLDVVYKEAMDYASNDIYQANQLIQQLYRSKRYDGVLWDIAAGPIDDGFVDFINEKYPSVKLENLYDIMTGFEADVPHLMVSINAHTRRGAKNRKLRDLANWAGDLLTSAGDATATVERGLYSSVYEAALDLIGSAEDKGTFGITDLLADADAINISDILMNNAELKINKVIKDYYSDTSNLSNRISRFVESRFGGLDQAQSAAEFYLTANFPLDLIIIRTIFKKKFTNMFGDPSTFNFKQGKEIARAFKDILASKINGEANALFISKR
ncbi:hypothetical protein [Paenibacillus jiagnxiensis]|uniref:hypothetical protein n=1 Tax=Paenibacillus jiagnxiensis TaxID=3228926 RepID=UPI0033B464F6